ncbi:MAG: hypothetical protein HQK83_10640 [Fibrobacteria bacterium]|nr:hypothetical protein [Fibrobacteria bacterium]
MSTSNLKQFKITMLFLNGVFVCLVFLILQGYLSGCSKLADNGIIDEEACYLCHEVPPALETGHILQFSGTYDYECSSCHKGYTINADTLSVAKALHKNGEIDVVFDEDYFKSRFVDTTRDFSKMQYSSGTCSNIPCHGYGMKGKEKTSWDSDSMLITWNDSASFTKWNVNATLGDSLDCNGCHNSTNHRSGENLDRCKNCHDLVTTDGISITNYSLHINGKVDKKKP